ncbi:hypothetical protein [Cucumibacter marinus]|uniref:hypothetical protein n=1 Tax=Cucumibacter marinus TaxID=1121252 RepID=UPI00048B8131|nr:hypothetical protein [Cucumibacter marinus]
MTMSADIAARRRQYRLALSQSHHARPAAWWRSVICLGLLVASMALWWAGLGYVDPARMGGLGLVTILPTMHFAGLGLVIVGFVVSVGGERPVRVLPALFLGVLIAYLHATPAIAYETLRYSWAWKHIGVIDFIMRTGSLDLDAQFLSAYFNWPAFFAGAAWLAALLGLGPLEIANAARFFPILLNLGYAALLPGIFFNLGASRRMALVGTALFILGNWVGQDYFSPQGTAFLFYLAVVYLATGVLALEPAGWRMRFYGLIARNTGFEIVTGRTRSDRSGAALLGICALVLIGLIIAMHQLTPLLVLSATFGLFVIGRLRIDLFVFALLAELLWLFYFADSFLAPELRDIIEGFGAVGEQTFGRLVDLHMVSDEQRIVALASRLLSAGIGLLAVLGGIIRLFQRKLDLAALVLLAAPLPLVVATPYGGEVIFRVYFYCLPFLAFFAAIPFAGRQRMGFLSGFVLMVVMTVFAGGFILANNGKDAQYRFTPLEVEASDWLYSRAQPGELLIEGARNYPSQFRNYENFIYVPLSEELPEANQELTSDPAGLVVRWLSEAQHGGYVIITRSQKNMYYSLGLLSEGGLDAVEAALLASPELKVVFANRDAAIFTLR